MRRSSLRNVRTLGFAVFGLAAIPSLIVFQAFITRIPDWGFSGVMFAGVPFLVLRLPHRHQRGRVLRARRPERAVVADRDRGIQAREGEGRRQAARLPRHRGRLRRRSGALRRRLRRRRGRDRRAARDERRGEVDASEGDQRHPGSVGRRRLSTTDARSRTSRATRSPAAASRTHPAAAASSRA